MVTHSSSLPEKEWNKAYSRELVLMLGIYAPTLVFALVLLHRVHGAWRYPVALVPVVPVAALPWIMDRTVRRIDERMRDAAFRSVYFGFFATAVATFAYGFLEIAGAPKVSMFTVAPVMVVLSLAARVTGAGRGRA